MISIQETRFILQKYGASYTEAEALIVRDWLVGLANLEYDISNVLKGRGEFTFGQVAICTSKES